MNNKKIIFKSADILKLSVLFFVILFFTAAGGEMKEIGFHEFREQLVKEGVDEFEVTFDGQETPAPVTGNKYVFNQIITYCGEDDDIMSSHRTWSSEENFILVYNRFRVKVNRSNVRIFIEETGSFKHKDEDDGRVLPSVEYGLVKNQKYFAKFSAEEYHLPPDRESGKPQKRVNNVLWISSRPYKNGKPRVELTPLYKGWSY
ncbi:MAG: hypothetical protein CVV49_20615 [Spirochaetae bacterium HGW-Spirochaetae-5]|nr:MAG: hypothetical protein CVV49_20615 [Spirochaetae bacterium HGW-Spirochaetae-5]